MTPCARYPDDDLVMRYASGDLAEPDLSAFEDHLFACDACLARVERYQAAQQVLASRHLPAIPTVVPATDEGARSTSRGLSWWVLSAVAAAVVVGLAAMFLVRGVGRPDVLTTGASAASSAASPGDAPVRPAGAGPTAMSPTSAANGRTAQSLQVAVLAMVSPPPYLPMVTRGDADAGERFAAGMDAYTRADWPTASRALREVDTPQARFYQGIADLMRGETAAAVASLEAARASARQPYARESLFYLGKAALQRGDVATAREWFSTARDAGAGPDREATRLLTALEEMLDPSEGRQ